MITVECFFLRVMKKKNVTNVEIKVRRKNKTSSYGSGIHANYSILKSFISSIL